MLKRYLVLVISCIMVFGLVGCANNAPAPTEQSNTGQQTTEKVTENEKEEPVTIRMGLATNKDTTIGKMAALFSDELNRQSNGSLDIEVYYDGTLGNDKDLVEGLTLGTVDMQINATTLYSNYEPLIGVLELPFMFRDFEHVHKVLDGEVGETLTQSVLEKSGVRMLGFPDGNFRLMYLRKAIDSIDDLNGINFRVPEAPVYHEMFKALGANPVPYPYLDVYMGMETGVIEGFDGPVDIAYLFKFHEVSNAVIVTRHMYTPYVITIRESLFSELSPEHQEVIQKVTKEVIEEFRAKSIETEQTHIKLFEESGSVIIDDWDIDVLAEKTSSMTDAFIEKHNAGDIVEQIKDNK